MFAAVLATIGGLAGGFLHRRSRALIAGALVGATVFGLIGVVSTLHLKGLVYSMLGAPIGALAVYLHALGQEPSKPCAGPPKLPAQRGVQDDDIDRGN